MGDGDDEVELEDPVGMGLRGWGHWENSSFLTRVVDCCGLKGTPVSCRFQLDAVLLS